VETNQIDYYYDPQLEKDHILNRICVSTSNLKVVIISYEKCIPAFWTFLFTNLANLLMNQLGFILLLKLISLHHYSLCPSFTCDDGRLEWFSSSMVIPLVSAVLRVFYTFSLNFPIILVKSSFVIEALTDILLLDSPPPPFDYYLLLGHLYILKGGNT